MPNEELQKRLNQMVEKAIRELNNNLAKADHLIIKLTTTINTGNLALC